MNETRTGNRAVIYARYSSAAQRDVSIEQQVKDCRKYAEREKLDVIRIYDDHAMTGRNDDRPAFQRMIKESAKGVFDYVIVYTLDRFSRNQFDSVYNKKILRDHGVRVISAMENLRDDPTGHLMESVLEGFAQYFSEELRQKTMRGTRSNAEKAMVIGPCPLGLCKGPDGKYAIVEKEAEIIREIYRRVATGEPFADIFRDLNERGVKTKKGRNWDRSSLNQILHNQKYVGLYSYSDIIIENGIPAILDQETFDKVQEICRTKSNSRNNPARRRTENGVFILTGKLYCGTCKASMVGVSANGHGGKYFYYTCSTHMDHKDQCSRKPVPRDQIEYRIASELQAVLRDQKVLSDMVDDILDFQRKQEDNGEIAILREQLAAKTQEKENTLKAIRMGAFTDSVVNMLKDLEAEEGSLRAKLVLAQDRRDSTATKSEIVTMIQLLAEGDPKDKKVQMRLIDTFLVKAYLYDDRIVLILDGAKKGADTITIPFDVDSIPASGTGPESIGELEVSGSYNLPNGVLSPAYTNLVRVLVIQGLAVLVSRNGRRQ